ncbi:MAG: glutamine-hydrolyzing GMP synthase [Verrucomicrobia bacterium]|nr:glutamine-hydrolyzing GMP synthase [Verrucomicrobiota bacterium]
MSDVREQIVILDFGSQYTQVIARRVREFNVFSTIMRPNTRAAEIDALAPNGIILSGGPMSVYQKDAPIPDPGIFTLGIPILGICYGMQVMGHLLGGKVAKGQKREYGRAEMEVTFPSCPLFTNLDPKQTVWMSHGDKLTELPRGFEAIARSSNSPFAAMECRERNLFGLQFHPEVVHTPHGREVLKNFMFRVCGCQGLWTMASFIERSVKEMRATVGNDRVILGLSGGVDSSVAAALIHKAIGDQLSPIFVNNGLLRKGEAESVERVFGKNFRMKLKTANAANLFLDRLKGVTDPERKRKIIGKTFIDVFEKNAKSVKGAKFLAQGTLYPDVIESVPTAGGPSAMIKSHHNVGGLPKRMKFKLLEPLRQLFKDEVRRVGEELGLPREIVWRQPFPGPGLAVRVLGAITKPRLDILREADAIVVEEMKNSGWYYKTWQSFAVLLPIRTVGVMGDERTYDHVIALRVVDSQDGMTADWVRLPPDLLARVSNRIINEVKGVNRVCLDISSKPPATIEWE